MPVEITEATIREIRAGCEGVADGPWETDFLNVCQPKTGFNTIITVRDDDEDQSVLTAEHVARLDPQTVAALCDDWLRMRGAVTKALAFYDALDVPHHDGEAAVLDGLASALSQATGKNK